MESVDYIQNLNKVIEQLEEDNIALKEKHELSIKKIAHDLIVSKTHIKELEDKLRKKRDGMLDKEEKKEINKRKKLEKKMKIVTGNF